MIVYLCCNFIQNIYYFAEEEDFSFEHTSYSCASDFDNALINYKYKIAPKKHAFPLTPNRIWEERGASKLYEIPQECTSLEQIEDWCRSQLAMRELIN